MIINMASFDDLNDEQKAAVMDLVILTVSEIRQQIIHDITVAEKMWEQKGWLKSRRTKKAFQVCKMMASGEHEKAVIEEE